MLGSVLELLLVQSLSWSLTIHFLLHITIQLRNDSCGTREDDVSIYNICAPEMSTREDDTSQWWFFWFLASSWGTHLLSFFHLSSLLQILNDHRMVDSEFFGNFRVVVRRSALMMLSIGRCQFLMAGHYAHLQGSRLLAKLLEPPLYRMFNSSSWAKCIVDFVSCHCYFMTHFELR